MRPPLFNMHSTNSWRNSIMGMIVIGIILIAGIGYLVHTVMTKRSPSTSSFTTSQKVARLFAMSGSIIILVSILTAILHMNRILTHNVPTDESGTGIGFMLAFMLPILLIGAIAVIVSIAYCIPAIFIKTTGLTYTLFILCSMLSVAGIWPSNLMLAVDDELRSFFAILPYISYVGPLLLLSGGMIGFVDTIKSRTRRAKTHRT